MDAVPTPLVLFANFLIALALFGFAASMGLVRLLSRRSVTLAALPLVSAVLFTLYVFGEDSYRGNGVSRWDAYRSPGGALGPMYGALRRSHGRMRCAAVLRRSPQ
jgi:hypothetical protein